MREIPRDGKARKGPVRATRNQNRVDAADAFERPKGTRRINSRMCSETFLILSIVVNPKREKYEKGAFRKSMACLNAHKVKWQMISPLLSFREGKIRRIFR